VAARAENRMCILVVEDDFLIRMVLVEELIDAGFDVVEAETGDEAIDLLDGIDPPLSLLITDIHMPGLRSGMDLAAHVSLSLPLVPIIYTTGRPEALDHAPISNERHILVRKPYVPSEIVARVEALLHK
jgi:DNA-binding response OmpR family regulator